MHSIGDAPLSSIDANNVDGWVILSTENGDMETFNMSTRDAIEDYEKMLIKPNTNQI